MYGNRCWFNNLVWDYVAAICILSIPPEKKGNCTGEIPWGSKLSQAEWTTSIDHLPVHCQSLQCSRRATKFSTPNKLCLRQLNTRNFNHHFHSPRNRAELLKPGCQGPLGFLPDHGQAAQTLHLLGRHAARDLGRRRHEEDDLRLFLRGEELPVTNGALARRVPGDLLAGSVTEIGDSVVL
jgi:hypothetical protein